MPEFLGRSYADVVTSPDVEPRLDSADPAEQFAAYLDHYRAVVVHKLDGLTEAQLRESRLPSGWTPLELLTHLVHMERRWFVWGFLGEQVAHPWGDNVDDAPESPWHVPDDVSRDELVAALHAGGARTRDVLESHDLVERAAVGGRFTVDDEVPTLLWICFHVLQEYARHAGHLDVVRELADGSTGE
ncbi:DinB family protein [Isoptericola nanjingensis]